MQMTNNYLKQTTAWIGRILEEINNSKNRSLNL